MPTRLKISDSGFESAFTAIVNAKRETESNVDDVVKTILENVKARGDEAVIEYTSRFDHFDVNPENVRISASEVQNAWRECDKVTKNALELAATRITDFHRRQLPEDLDYIDKQGIRLGYRWQSLNAVGLYVPGGTAAYPSSVLMNAIPAKVASVDRVVMTVPATNGQLNPLVLVAAQIAGVTEIYRIGGAQAIGALAYGTETIVPVDKIVGPGNAYVASAKRQVFGVVGIDMIAGPSEILVVADDENDPDWIAADLISQAEHDTSAQSILITDSEKFAESVTQAVEDLLTTLPRNEIARESWEKFGTVIVVQKLVDAVPLIDRLAPEHLELATDQADDLAKRVRNAGAIFLGRYTPEAIGDYIAGPNHVLPTARSARFSSGLSVLDFLKRTSLVSCDSASLVNVGPQVVTLAKAEGLDAHALSVALRLKEQD